MEAGIGQRYGIQVNGPQATVALSAAGIIDLYTYTAAAGIPAYIEWLRLSAAISQAQSVPINLVLRSTAGSGGSTTLSSAKAEPPSGSNMSGAQAYLVTTVGTLVSTIDSGSWQLFGQFVFSREPGGLLIPGGQTFAISVPQSAINGNFNYYVGGKITEAK